MLVHGLEVHELGRGRGPSVVLLHAMGTSGWMWHSVAEDLARSFHVIVPDLPGHGGSNEVPWVSMAETATLVDQIIASRAGGGQAHLVGLSLGGYVGLEAAATSSRVRSVMVSGVNVLPFPHPGLMKAAGHLLSPVMQSNVFIRWNARMLKVPADQLDGFRSAAKATDRESLRTINGQALHFTLPESLAQKDVPVLAVAGSKEHTLILQSLSTIRASVSRAVVGTVPGMHHGWIGEQPRLFEQATRHWLEHQTAPTGLTPLSPTGS